MPFAEGDRTPLVLAGLLTLGLLVQLALPAAPMPMQPAHPQRTYHGRIAGLPQPNVPIISATILDHPLFSPTRSGQVAVLPDVAPVGAFALLGSVTGGGRASAVLSTPGAGAQVVKLGDSLLGWRLVAVGRDRATVERNGARQTLVLGAPAALTGSPPSTPGRQGAPL